MGWTLVVIGFAAATTVACNVGFAVAPAAVGELDRGSSNSTTSGDSSGGSACPEKGDAAVHVGAGSAWEDSGQALNDGGGACEDAPVE
jgi:hypothetical protein